MRRTLGAFLLVVWCAACGGDDAPDGGPVTLDELPDAYVDVLCDRIIECSVFGALIFSQTGCDSLSYEFRNDTAALIQQGIDAGTIVYDPEAAGACIAALAGASCEDLSLETLGDLEACEGAIVGQQGDGDACGDSIECATGLYCDTGLACPGACAPRVEASGDCSNGATCAAGLVCDSTSVCSAPISSGDDCAEEECRFGLVCSETSQTCVPLTHDADDGDPCDPSEGVMCSGALICTAEEADAFVCRARSTVGGSCYVGVPNPCPPDSYCSATEVAIEGTCEALPVAGEPCRTDGGLFDLECAGDAACDDDSGDCVARVDNGVACTVDAECANGCATTCSEPDPCVD